MGCRQVVRLWTLTPPFVGSNPATPVLNSLFILVNNNQIQSLFYLEYSNGTITKATHLTKNDMFKISSITFYEKIKL
jgi:hypothetical protein